MDNYKEKGWIRMAVLEAAPVSMASDPQVIEELIVDVTEDYKRMTTDPDDKRLTGDKLEEALTVNIAARYLVHG